MIKTLQNTLKQDREGFVLPKSVQDAIPIRRLWPDGIFQFGSKFSKTIHVALKNMITGEQQKLTIEEVLEAIKAAR